MAVTKAKKKAVKKPATKSARKTSVDEEESDLNSTGREIGGWFFIALATLFLISLLSEFASAGSANLMGAYLGEWLATTLIRIAGKLPSLLFIVMLFSLGIHVLQLSVIKVSSRFTGFMLLLFIEISILLSLKNLEVAQFALEDFENTGGVVGNFLVDFLYASLFGESTFLAYAFTLTALFFSVIWATEFRPSTIIDKVLITVSDYREEARLRKVAKRQELENRVKEYEAAEIEVVKKAKKKKKSEPKVADTTQETPFFEPIEDDADISNDYVNELKEMAKDPTLDPREKRRVRDELARVQRMSELNDWEDRDTQKVKIGGLIGKQGAKGSKAEEGAESTKKLTKKESKALQNKKSDSESIAGDLKQEAENNSGTEISEDEKETKAISVIKQREITAAKKREVKYDTYVIPEVTTLLPSPPFQEVSYTEAELMDLSKHLEVQLANFRVKGKVTGICTGPIITRFEIDLAPGVKVSKISGLSDDLALALRAKSVRILAPIPGKAAVGIEIPNLKPHIVFGRDVFESDAFQTGPDNIMLALGKDIAGDAFTLDLAAAPHLLIAGQTGSGKSVCINTIMASIIATKTPDELRMILVDPKVVELKPYEKIPHLLHPVITSPDIAIQALKWACIEMDRRYEVLAKGGVRNLFGFNQKFKDGALEGRVDTEDNMLMPYLVIVIDELADLMMVAGKEVETSIARIAQKARAVGIHLILATQRPSVQVITGTIKANLPSRISFKVASQIDARTVLDKMGAEKLLGRGDMLVRTVRDPEAVRAHGAFLSDQDIEAIVEQSANQFVNYPQLEAFDTGEGDGATEADFGPRDSKFNEAAELVVHAGSASTSMLQRRLGVGYARAGKIIDQMEGNGIIGPPKGSKPREVLLNDTELMSFLSGDVDQIILD
ncbi:MAG: DNA translocase FtsK [Fibrobacterales bacterium]